MATKKVSEAAPAVGRKVSTLYDWIRRGMLPEKFGEDGLLVVDIAQAKAVSKTVRHGRPRK